MVRLHEVDMNEDRKRLNKKAEKDIRDVILLIRKASELENVFSDEKKVQNFLNELNRKTKELSVEYTNLLLKYGKSLLYKK